MHYQAKWQRFTGCIYIMSRDGMKTVRSQQHQWRSNANYSHQPLVMKPLKNDHIWTILIRICRIVQIKHKLLLKRLQQLGTISFESSDHMTACFRHVGDVYGSGSWCRSKWLWWTNICLHLTRCCMSVILDYVFVLFPLSCPGPQPSWRIRTSVSSGRCQYW